MDVAKIEKAEAELDAFLKRRARQSKEANTVEAMWAESVRKDRERRRERNRWEWIRFFDRMAWNHALLSASYEKRAEKLLEDGNERSK